MFIPAIRCRRCRPTSARCAGGRSLLARILRDAGLSPDTVRLAAGALWLLEMAALLLDVHDESPGGARTHRLVDDALDLVVPMLPVLDTPFGRDLAARVVAALDRAGSRC